MDTESTKRLDTGQMFGRVAMWDSAREFLQQSTIIVYHRDDRQNLFRELFIQIKAQVECKYLLSSSPEWICQSFYLIFLTARPWSRKIVGTMLINCVPFQLFLSFEIIISYLKCFDTVYQLKMYRFKTELDSELRSKTASTNIVVIKVIINVALMDGDIRKKSRCHIFQPLLWQIKF